MNKIEFNSRREEYRFLSNFTEYPIIIDGVRFLNVEQYFQYSKFEEYEVEHKQRILDCKTDSEAKKLGQSRKHKMRKDWDAIKLTFMARGLYAKFTQHAELRKALLDTGEIELVEAAYWNPKSSNTLGRLLMALREELRKDPDYVQY